MCEFFVIRRYCPCPAGTNLCQYRKLDTSFTYGGRFCHLLGDTEDVRTCPDQERKHGTCSASRDCPNTSVRDRNPDIDRIASIKVLDGPCWSCQQKCVPLISSDVKIKKEEED